MKHVVCPSCKRKGDWFAGRYGPFCSHRCRLVDLGKWLGEEHAISSPLHPEQPESRVGGPPGTHPEAADAGNDN